MTDDPPRSESGLLSVETVFDAIGHHHRRVVLRQLRDRNPDEVLTLDDLAAAVVAAERGVHPGDADPDALASARIALYHAHLPKLADAGAIAYDVETGTVRPARIAPFIDGIDAADERAAGG